MLNEYTGVRHISNLVDPLLLGLASGIVNIKGQVYIFDSGVDIDPFLNRPIYFINARRGGVQTLGELIFGDGGRSRMEMAQSSYFIDCIFENLSGNEASALMISQSRVTFLSGRQLGEIIHFKNNVSTESSTVYAVQSVILFRDIVSVQNTANRGGSI